MAKRMKEKDKKSKMKFFVIPIVFVSIIIILILKESVLQNNNKSVVEETEKVLQNNEIIEEKYVIEDFENFSFQNAEIKTENNISYINIDVKNKSEEKSKKRKIIIKLSSETKQIEMAYTLPEIEGNKIYKMQLSVISNLTDVEVIEIK